MIKDKEHKFYMNQAIAASEMSYAERKKVGACVVTKHKGIFIGYNGTGPGENNCCEDESFELRAIKESDLVVGFTSFPRERVLTTKKNVRHAELNCFAKMLKEGVSAEGSTLYVTLSPCTFCASMIASAGVSKVVYLEEYRDTEGLKILMDSSVLVEKYNQ